MPTSTPEPSPPPVPPRLTASTLVFTLRPQRPLRLPPFVGATLRGAIGHALRRLACLTGAPACDGCALADRCAYGLLWESEIAAAAGARLQRHRNPQRPYVLSAPVGDPEGAPFRVSPSSELSFEITLFGVGRAFSHQVVLAVGRAARDGLGPGRPPAELVRVEVLGPDPDARHPYDPTAPLPYTVLTPTLPAGAPSLPPRGRVRLELETPLRLKSQRRVLERFDPEILTARLLERLDLLALLYERHRTTWDYAALRDLAGHARVVRTQDLRMVRFKRHSLRSPGRVPMMGLLGTVWLDDVAPSLYALWSSASLVHAGGYASFGFGRLRVTHLGASPRVATSPEPPAPEPPVSSSVSPSASPSAPESAPPAPEPLPTPARVTFATPLESASAAPESAPSVPVALP